MAQGFGLEPLQLRQVRPSPVGFHVVATKPYGGSQKELVQILLGQTRQPFLERLPFSPGGFLLSQALDSRFQFAGLR